VLPGLLKKRPGFFIPRHPRRIGGMSSHYEARSALGQVVNEIEETAIAILLGLMTIITFINVVLRYGFNTGLIWGWRL
jgi:hypothetical protein